MFYSSGVQTFWLDLDTVRMCYKKSCLAYFENKFLLLPRFNF